MDTVKVQLLYPLLHSKVTSVRNDWVMGHCPFAPWRHQDGKDKHPSFGIKANKQKRSIFKCFACGSGGGLMDLVRELGILLKKSPVEGYKLGQVLQLVANEFESLEFDPDIPDWTGHPFTGAAFVEYPEFFVESFKQYSLFSQVVDYLHSRRISSELATIFDLRYDSILDRVCFPIRDFKGRLAGLQGRALDNSVELRYFFYKYHGALNSHIWFGEDRVNFDKPLVLVEGVFDALRVYSQYENVVASLSAGISKEKITRMADAVEIITLYDWGMGGNSARKRVHEVMKGKTPVVDLIPEEDEGDAGAMDDETIRSYLSPHVKLKAL